MKQLKIDRQNLIIRHSIREQITDPKDSQRQELTEEGILLAQQFGKKIALYSDKFSLFHSPVIRCEQTAIEISKGINSCSKNVYKIEPMELLKGFFFINLDYCSELIKQQIFLREWFAGEISSDYIIPIKNAANEMLNEIISQQYNDVTKIFITHDFNIFSLRSLYSKTFEDIEYPDYLDGLIISNDMSYFENIKFNKI
jgi:broad specificity phosphatase PhoE